MIHTNPDWDALSRSIQDIVDRAVNARDFSHLSQTIRQTVDAGAQTVRKTIQSVQNKTEVKKNLPVLYGSTKKQSSGALPRSQAARCSPAVLSCWRVLPSCWKP